MERRDWNLLVLAAAGGEPLTPVQLQKSLFLLGKAIPARLDSEDYYRFEPYNYGPFDSTVYLDAANIAYHRLALDSEQDRRKQYVATPRGIEKAKELEKALQPELVDYIHKLVAWVRAQSFTSLLQVIYQQYPEMKVNSVFAG
jgi:hypothetical protein